VARRARRVLEPKNGTGGRETMLQTSSVSRLYRQVFGDQFRLDLPKSKRKLRETWRPYLEAELGLRNYWYPICLGHELDDGNVVAQKICGERIIVRRVDGQPYAMEDRCPHRQVPLSMRIECHTHDTISCWYHGFTMNWKTGNLDTIICEPDADIINKVSIKTYPAQEAHGVVFVFIGDIDPPPLFNDVPSDFMDERNTIFGRRTEIRGNWRLASENGFDSAHVFVHRNSPFFDIAEFVVPIAVTAQAHHENRLKYYVRPDDGPVGVIDDLIANYDTVWTADINEVEDAVSGNPRVLEEDLEVHVPEISIWLPCGLMARHFPTKRLNAYEFYVPVDAENHLYFQLLANRNCRTDEEKAAFRKDVDDHWSEKMMDDFNRDDVFARIGMQEGYGDGRGWVEEVLTHNDIPVIAWRQIVSRFNRGIQTLPSFQ
jgi:carbazole 1,9a-dioxygenase terminal dioxygenase component